MNENNLYKWQKEALDKWLKDNERGIIEACTGSGKTRVAIEIIRK